MTNINDISDLVRILRENPDWTDILRGILLSRELLELPTKFPELVAAVAELTAGQAELRAVVAELTAGQAELRAGQAELRAVVAELTAGQAELRAVVAELVTANTELRRMVSIHYHRLDRIEGKIGNLEGNDYERKVRYRVLTRATTIMGLEEPYLALSQNDPESPQLSGAVSNALRERRIDHDEADDLHNTDIIISDPANRHLAVEVSLSSDLDDYRRAYRRAAILRTVTQGEVRPVVVIPDQHERPVSEEVQDVATLVIPQT